MSVEVRVDFHVRGCRWARRFTVPKGTTVLQLKEALVRPRGARTDACCFALLRGGELLFDGEPLEEDLRADFRFVGRADAPRPQRGASGEVEAAEPLAWVDVVVKHARPELESQVSVRVPESATALAVRLEALRALGERRLGEVRLVAKKGDGLFVPIPDSELIGTRRMFLAVGRRLDGLPPDRPARKADAGADAPVLTKEHALRLQSELMRGFADAAFQEKLRALAEQPAKRQALILTVQREVLPRYGFEGSLRGVLMMLNAMAPFHHSEDFMRSGHRIEMLLAGLDVDVPLPGQAPEKRDAPSGSLQVVVELSADSPRATSCVSVPRGSTVLRVKQRLCAQDPLGKARPETFRLCAPQAPERPLGDEEEVSEALARLRILPVEPEPAPAEPAPAEPAPAERPAAEPAAAGRPAAERPAAEPAAAEPAAAEPPAEPPAPPAAQPPAQPEPRPDVQEEPPHTPRTASRAFDFDVLDALDDRGDSAAGVRDETTPEQGAGRVRVTLVHATNGTRMTLEVPEGSTILEVRQAAIQRLGEKKLFNLKIVKKHKGSYVSEPSESLLNGRSELWTLGCDLADGG